MSYTLGLDVGANSIGWALVDAEAGKLVASGVRVFPEGVDNFDTKKEAPKMAARRVARGMRRQIARRSARKRALRGLLTKAGLLPLDAVGQVALDGLNPYVLRRRALTERLTPHEFGRVLIHLNQRRGFKSNRKSDRGRKSDDKGILAEMSALAKSIEESGSATLGDFLAQKLEAAPLERIRNRHTRREMFCAEFEKCWAKQKEFEPAILTDALKHEIRRVMFFQRALYWPASVVGLCELEPRLKRCPRADRRAQKFRLLQEVNNLRYFDPDAREERRLTDEQRTLLLAKLSVKPKMDFDQIRKELGFLDSIKFNLERGKRKGMKGMPTDAALAHKDLFGKRWHELSEAKKNEFVRKLIDAEDEGLSQLATEWGLSVELADKLAGVDMPEGYGALSALALEKLLPHMERGLLYMTDDKTPCALSEAGYLRPDQKNRPILAALPEPPDIANPVVRQALFELRRVVNAIIREYGKPARIHIELARNATMSLKQRQEASSHRQENEDRRSAAAEMIRSAGIKVSREGIDRVMLWQDQSETCVYSGHPISLTQLLHGEVDIDHILPYSRCLDDSMANKVVAFRGMNHEKGNRTPREWLETDPGRYERILQLASRLAYPKRKRFVQKELELDSFVQRQLNDTRYIARSAAAYLRTIVDEPHHVLCPKGSHTAEPRRHWGLNSVLRSLPDSPAWKGENDLRDGEKDRSDHRHHVIDALVVALTDQSRLQHLARIRRQGGTETTGEVLGDPWGNFLPSVIEAVSKINVSHRVQRRVSGALHEDTIYGPVRKKNIKGELEAQSGEFVVRKTLNSLTPAMVEDIRDATIKAIVISRLREHNAPFGRGAKGTISKEVWQPQLTMPSGIPIRKVRIIKRDETIQSIRSGTVFVKPGSTHHLCIFEFTEKGKKKRDAVFVTMLGAINRIKRGEPIIQRAHPERPDAKFVMSLSRGEMVWAKFKDKEMLATLTTSVSTEKRMLFIAHTDARKSADVDPLRVSVNTFIGRKVTVDPLGRIRWAND